MPDVRFARSEDVSVAYAVHGEGPIDIVYVQGGASHLDAMWELQPYRRFVERLTEFARVDPVSTSAAWACPTAYLARRRSRPVWMTSAPSWMRPVANVP